MAGVECVGQGTQTVSPPYSPPSTRHSLHWSRHLKCQVCFGYLKQPVTLSCGHSFCRRCLVLITNTIKALNPDVSQRFLRISCPTCRTVFPASNMLQGRMPASFPTDWKGGRSRFRSNSCATFSSIVAKTSPTRQSRFHQKTEEQNKGNWREEYHMVWRPDQGHTAMMSDVNPESSDELEFQLASSATPVVGKKDSEQEASTTNSNASLSSAASDIRGFQLGGRRIRRRGAFLQFNCSDSSESSPVRGALMAIWSMYSIVVVTLARSMWPVTVLLSILFLSFIQVAYT